MYSIGFISVSYLLLNPLSLRRTLLLSLFLLLWTAPVIAIAAQIIDRRSIDDLGLHLSLEWVLDAFAGVVIGFAIPAGLVVALLLINGIETFHLDPALSPFDPALFFAISLLIAIVEELIFRGYILRNSAEGLCSRWFSKNEATLLAWAISALFFMHVHETPNFFSVVFFVGAGLLLGVAYVHTGELGLSIGIHAGYNFGTVRVFNLSGEAERSLLTVTTSMPPDFDGQTRLLLIVFVIIAFLLLELWIRISYGWPEIKAQLAIYEMNEQK